MWVIWLKSERDCAEAPSMRFERLVIEADENTFSLDFHPRLTVISGVGRLEHEGLISELVGSGAVSVADVRAACGASSDCGSCANTIRSMVQQGRGSSVAVTL